MAETTYTDDPNPLFGRLGTRVPVPVYPAGFADAPGPYPDYNPSPRTEEPPVHAVPPPQPAPAMTGPSEATIGLNVTGSPDDRAERARLAQSALPAVTTTPAQREQEQRERMGALTRAQEERQAYERERVQGRAPLVAAQQTSIETMLEGLKKDPPVIPEWTKLPNPPDVKVRPWLDPEGKSALEMIAKDLSMLATGISGLVIGAPKTAIKQFTAAAEAWRQDEKDRAESNWQQFQATVEQIRTDNTTALAVWDRANQQYGQNRLAERAAVIANAQAVGLYDAATNAALMPRDDAIKDLEKNIDLATKIDDEARKWAVIQNRHETAAEKLPGNTIGLIAEVNKLKAELQDPTLSAEERKDKTVRLGYLQQTVSQHQANLEDQRRKAFDATFARQDLAKVEPALQNIRVVKPLIADLDWAYKKLNELGMLPPTASSYDAWLQRLKNLPPERWTKDANKAMATIKEFYAPTNVQIARTLYDEKNMRVKAGFGGFLDKPQVITLDGWLRIRDTWAQSIDIASAGYLARRASDYEMMGMTPQQQQQRAGGEDE